MNFKHVFLQFILITFGLSNSLADLAISLEEKSESALALKSEIFAEKATKLPQRSRKGGTEITLRKAKDRCPICPQTIASISRQVSAVSLPQRNLCVPFAFLRLGVWLFPDWLRLVRIRYFPLPPHKTYKVVIDCFYLIYIVAVRRLGTHFATSKG